MANFAKFTINATASSPPGFDATTGQVLTLALEGGPAASVQRWTVEVYDATDAKSPRASKGAPTLTLVGATSGQKVDATTPASTVTVTIPSGTNLWIIRSKVNGGVNPNGTPNPEYVYERAVVVRDGSGRRKVVATEQTQYGDGGWADAVNDMLGTEAPGLPNGTEIAQELKWTGTIYIPQWGWDKPSVDNTGNPAAAATNTANIVASMNRKNGVCVALPPGIIYYNAAMATSLNGVTVLGREGGIGGTELINSAASAIDSLTFSGGQNCSVRGIRFASTTVWTTGFVIKFSGCFAPRVEQCRMDQMANGVWALSSSRVDINDLQVRDSFGSRGILFTGTSLAVAQALVIRNSGGDITHPFPDAGQGADWAPSTAYVVGNVRWNAGNLYQCSQNGTSAASGGPSGIPTSNPSTARATDITDGTAKWRYLCNGDYTHYAHGPFAYSTEMFAACGWLSGARGILMYDDVLSGGSTPGYLFAKDCSIDHPFARGAELQRGYEADFDNIWISSVFQHNGIEVGAGFDHDWTVRGSRIFGCAEYGIYALKGYGKVMDTRIANCSTRTSNAYDAIFVGNGVQRYQLLNNWCGDIGGGAGQMRWGINNGDATNDHFVIAGNLLNGNLTGGLNNPAGTGATKVAANNAT